jgi:hypothetical protein
VLNPPSCKSGGNLRKRRILCIWHALARSWFLIVVKTA